jgi:hypothetical protein
MKASIRTKLNTKKLRFKNGDLVRIQWWNVGRNDSGFEHGWTPPLKIWYPMGAGLGGQLYMVTDAIGRSSPVIDTLLERV